MLEQDARHKIMVWVYHEAPEGTRILVLRRAPPKPSEWHPVTGHVEPGETLEEAARREVAEETGCTPVDLLDLGYNYGFTGTLHGEERPFMEHAFAMRVADGTCRLSHEHDEYRWVPLDEAGTLLQFPEQREALRHLAERLSISVPWDEP